MAAGAVKEEICKLRVLCDSEKAGSGEISGVAEIHQVLLQEIHSEGAKATFLRDPYWPKWQTPWWKLLLLLELDLIIGADQEIILEYTALFNNHYLQFFPRDESELPPDCDPYRHILCFCAAGSFMKLLQTAGLSLTTHVPWLVEWYDRYVLYDGGYNCDDAVYRKENGKSSLESTLPMLEALLYQYDELTDRSHEILNEGAQYLINHNLCFSTTGSLIDKRWLDFHFPRFYFYDLYHAFFFLAEWAHHEQRKLPETLIHLACLNCIRTLTEKRPFSSEHLQQGTLIYNCAEKKWHWQDNPITPSILKYDQIQTIGRKIFIRKVLRALKNLGL